MKAAVIMREERGLHTGLHVLVLSFMSILKSFTIRNVEVLCSLQSLYNNPCIPCGS
jgi:hypothetical protein